MRADARAALDEHTWAYYEATAAASPGGAGGGAAGGGAAAGGAAAAGAESSDAAEPGAGASSWGRFSLVPRVLTGAARPDPTVTLPPELHRGGAELRSPIMVSPTAGHGMAHPDGEMATARAAAACGALMVYSNSATVDVVRFGAATRSPWWVQLYLRAERQVSEIYLERAAEAGAGAVVLTADLATAGPGTDPTFRSSVQATLPTTLGNYPGLTWGEVSAGYATGVTWRVVDEIASRTGLPVHVKGILHPDDALRAVDAGAASVIVSNHGRRQLPGVVSTAEALGPIVAAVDGRVPVLVDGDIRSGADVARALALGADLVGIGKPVLWALAGGGQERVRQVLDGLTGELVQVLTALGAARPSDLGRGHLYRA